MKITVEYDPTTHKILPFDPTDEMLQSMRSVIELYYNPANYAQMYKEKHAYKALFKVAPSFPAQSEQDIAVFEVLAKYQGLQDFTKAADKAKEGEIPATFGGQFSPATYYNFITELAYRVWANKPATPLPQGEQLEQMTFERDCYANDLRIAHKKLAEFTAQPVPEDAERVTRERNALANAIRDAAVNAKMCGKDHELTGPQLIMLCGDMADYINHLECNPSTQQVPDKPMSDSSLPTMNKFASKAEVEKLVKFAYAQASHPMGYNPIDFILHFLKVSQHTKGNQL